MQEVSAPAALRPRRSIPSLPSDLRLKRGDSTSAGKRTEEEEETWRQMSKTASASSASSGRHGLRHTGARHADGPAAATTHTNGQQQGANMGTNKHSFYNGRAQNSPSHAAGTDCPTRAVRDVPSMSVCLTWPRRAEARLAHRRRGQRSGTPNPHFLWVMSVTPQEDVRDPFSV